MLRYAGLGVGAAVLLAAVVSGQLFPRSATVTVRLQPESVAVPVTVTGSRDSGYFSTREVTVAVTDGMRVPASPAEVGTYATGRVTFVHYSGCTRECFATYMLPAGYELLSKTGVAYRTLAEVHWSEGQVSAPVGIQAEVPGPIGNTGAHTIVQTRLWPGWMVPDNAQPITGGTSRPTHKVTQTDLDGALAALYDRLQPEVQDAMVLNASVLVFSEEDLPRYTYFADHAVGDETPWFNVKMTATLSANGFSDKQARSLIAAGLPRHVGAVQTSYEITEITTDGDVRLTGTATSYALPAVDRAAWQRRLASTSVDGARAELMRAFPGAVVDIKTFGAPSLPASPERINLVFEPLPSDPA